MIRCRLCELDMYLVIPKRVKFLATLSNLSCCLRTIIMMGEPGIQRKRALQFCGIVGNSEKIEFAVPLSLMCFID